MSWRMQLYVSLMDRKKDTVKDSVKLLNFVRFFNGWLRRSLWRSITGMIGDVHRVCLPTVERFHVCRWCKPPETILFDHIEEVVNRKAGVELKEGYFYVIVYISSFGVEGDRALTLNLSSESHSPSLPIRSRVRLFFRLDQLCSSCTELIHGRNIQPRMRRSSLQELISLCEYRPAECVHIAGWVYQCDRSSMRSHWLIFQS